MFDKKIDKKLILDTMQCFEDSPQYEKYSRIYDEVIVDSVDCVEPVGYYCELSGDVSHEAPYERMVYCLVTLGEDMDKAISGYFGQNEYLKGMMLNTIGDQLLFDTALGFSRFLDRTYGEKGLGLSRAYNPGDDDIPLKMQEDILGVIEGENETGITLTSGYMFSPQKTMSFYHGIASDLELATYVHDCKTCSAVSCMYRKVNLTVIRDDEDETVQVPVGMNLLDALRSQDYHVPAYCNGKGSCGKCKVIDLHGSLERTPDEIAILTEAEVKKGLVLACYHRLQNHLTVAIPTENQSAKILSDFQLVKPHRKDEASLPPSSYDSSTPMRESYRPKYEQVRIDGFSVASLEGCDVTGFIKKQFGYDYGYTLDGFHDLSFLVGLASPFYLLVKNQREVLRASKELPRAYGIGVDIGTTTVVLTLVDLIGYEVMDSYKVMNPQGAYGADVISRIQHDIQDKDHVQTRVIRETIRKGIQSLMLSHGLTQRELVDVTISGNTTMAYLLLGMNPYPLSVSPFTTVHNGIMHYPYNRLFHGVHSDLSVTLLPNISAYIGSDITSGFYYCDFLQETGNHLFVDIGTNGEMALKTSEGILCASTAAGPAFEGANIRCGMASTHGAIYHVGYENGQFIYDVIGDVLPRGICGSALVDMVAILLEEGLMDKTGKLTQGEAVTLYEDQDTKIALYQEDIRQLQLAKSAIRAGIEVLLMEAGLTPKDVDRFYLAGGFGSHLDIPHAIAIGLIPSELEHLVHLVGNSALGGCAKYMMDSNGDKAFQALQDACSLIELSLHVAFNEAYIDHMFF